MTRLIDASSVEAAWSKLFSLCDGNARHDSTPVVVSIAGSDMLAVKNLALADALDATLRDNDIPQTRDTAYTIFPESYWTSRKWPSIELFFSAYLERQLPRLLSRSSLKYGTYFERLVSYRPHAGASEGVPQLKFVIEQMQGQRWFRSSGLQMVVFNPSLDLTRQPVRGFPCLQQVGVFRAGRGQGFGLSAMYPVQYVVDRAYGNYKGLIQLGKFIEQQTQRPFEHLSCYVVSPRLGTVKKRHLEAVRDAIAKAECAIEGAEHARSHV